MVAVVGVVVVVVAVVVVVVVVMIRARRRRDEKMLTRVTRWNDIPPRTSCYMCETSRLSVSVKSSLERTADISL
jgi:hypothetical protein